MGMSEHTFVEGDLVEATKGEAVARGRLATSHYKINDTERALQIDGFPTVPPANAEPTNQGGWIYKLIEKARPKVPTEPGWYWSSRFPMDNLDYSPYRLTVDGEWFEFHTPTTLGEVSREDVEELAPFIQMEPVTVVVRRIIHEIAKGIRGTHSEDVNGDRAYLSRNIDYILDKIAGEFL